MIENDFVVTTNIKYTADIEKKAEKIAEEFNVNYIKRGKETIRNILKKYNNVFVIYKDKLVFYNDLENKLFFHLDTVKIRLKNKNEALIDAIKLKNQNILDMTMGLARDSVVLSYYGHKVTSLENNKIIYKIVTTGLKRYDSRDNKINECMKKINAINIDYYKYLKNCPDNEFDIIYFDPMFEYKIKDSKNLEAISNIADKNKITKELFKEMKRVAKKKIIIKAHNRDKIFSEFNLKINMRAGSKFSYGILEIGE